MVLAGMTLCGTLLVLTGIWLTTTVSVQGCDGGILLRSCALSSSTEICLIQLKNCFLEERNNSKIISVGLCVQFNSSSETTTCTCNSTTCDANLQQMYM